MTPQEIIDKVTGETSRVDYAEKLLAHFPAILRQVHSIDKFTHDLETYHIVDPAILNSTVSLPLNTTFPRLRDVAVIKTYQGYTGAGSDIDPYVGVSEHNIQWLQATAGRPLTDYFGFVQTNTYFKMGNFFTLKGVEANTRLIEILSISWPTWVHDDLGDEYTTSSWICEKFPEIIEAHLKLAIFRMAQSDDGIREANSYIRETTDSFIKTFSGDLYHAS